VALIYGVKEATEAKIVSYFTLFQIQVIDV